MKKLLALSMVLLPVAGMAQERSAGQAYDAQVNWASLKNSIDLVNAQNRALTATIAKMQACNVKKKIYTPADTAADTDGCVGVGVGTPCAARSFTLYSAPASTAECPATEHGAVARCTVMVNSGRRNPPTVVDPHKHFLGQCYNGVITQFDFFDVTPPAQPYNAPNGSNGGAGG